MAWVPPSPALPSSFPFPSLSRVQEECRAGQGREGSKGDRGRQSEPRDSAGSPSPSLKSTLPLSSHLTRIPHTKHTHTHTHTDTGVVGGSWSKEIPVSDIFRLLHPSLKDNHWVSVFKALIVVHILLRDGDVDRIAGFLCGNMSLLDVSMFRDRSGSGLGRR